MQQLWDQYCEWTDATAEVPYSNACYYGLGLLCEILEWIEDPTPDELGDVCWYLAGYIRSMDCNIDWVSCQTRFEDVHDLPLSLLMRHAHHLSQLAIKRIRGKEDDVVVRESFQDLACLIVKFMAPATDIPLGLVWRGNIAKLYPIYGLPLPPTVAQSVQELRGEGIID